MTRIEIAGVSSAAGLRGGFYIFSSRDGKIVVF